MQTAIIVIPILIAVILGIIVWFALKEARPSGGSRVRDVRRGSKQVKEAHQARLIDRQTSREIQLSNTVNVIGRFDPQVMATPPDLEISENRGVSRMHALICFEDGKWKFINKSRYGSVVDEKPIVDEVPRDLHHLANIEIGSRSFQFVTRDQTQPRVLDYEILDICGTGGMSEVYRARKMSSRSMVAIKTPKRVHGEAEYIGDARIEHEYNLLRKLAGKGGGYGMYPMAHETISTVDGRMALVMELLQGDTLLRALNQGTAPIAVACAVGAQILKAADEIHRKTGHVHLDLKPENVLFRRQIQQPDDWKDHLVIIDFGTAVRINHPARVSGTPAYQSPEHVGGGVVTPMADVYSVGCILYHLFTGGRVFPTSDPAEMRKLQQTARPKALREACREQNAPVPPAEVCRLIEAMLEKGASNRPEAAEAVRILTHV